MNGRISKSFKTIFSSLYPNFDDTERENAEEYFFFILKNYPDKRFRSNINSPQEIMGREDRKYGDQSGNRVLCRFYNQ